MLQEAKEVCSMTTHILEKLSQELQGIQRYQQEKAALATAQEVALNADVVLGIP